MRSSARTGYSLLELLVAVTILLFLLGIPFLLLRSSQRLQVGVTTRAELQSEGRRTLERIADRLGRSGASVIPQAALGPNLWTATIDFQGAADWVGGAVVWSNAERIALVLSPNDPDDGADNDGDGRIDERRVVWTTDVGLGTQRSLVLCDDVPERMQGELANGADDNGNGLVDEPGLAFSFGNDQVQVELSLNGRDAAGAWIADTSERAIAFRN